MEQNQLTNSFYAMEDRRERPKDYFQMVLSDLKRTVDLSKINSICDVGCATGDFLWYVQRELENNTGISYTGLDVLEPLLAVAKERMPKTDFKICDIVKNKPPARETFDVTTALGVIYLYDDFRCALDNLIKITRQGGLLYIFSSFNQYGYDVRINYRDVTHGQCGNIRVFSTAEITAYLDSLQLKHEWIPFHIHQKIECNENDYLRSWTVSLKNDTYGIIDGLNRWREQFLLKIFC